MYRVTAECDGREQLGTAETRDCFAAMTVPVPDAEDAAVAARTLKQAAERQGWNTDRYDEHEVLFCPGCWPSWLEFEERRMMGTGQEGER